MKILILGDIHGRDFWIDPCYDIDEFDKVIFLGDYHDPYPFQVSADISRHRLRDILLPFVLEHKDKVICLLGNHDGNYVIGEMADRIDVFHKEEIAHYLNQMDLKLAHQEGKYLFTHSGVLPAWLKYNNITLDDVLAGKVSDDALVQVSPNRGGCDPYGSCIWGDVSEYAFSKKIPGIFQIFGHTQIEKEIITDEFACLDCRKAFVLDTEEETLEEYNQWRIYDRGRPEKVEYIQNEINDCIKLRNRLSEIISDSNLCEKVRCDLSTMICNYFNTYIPNLEG